MMEYSFGVIPCRKGKEGWELLLVFDRHGNWGFPKGHPDPDEKPLTTAQRELLEETGLQIKEWIPSPELITRYTHDGIPKEVCYFIAHVEGEAKACPPEVTQVKWVAPNQAASLATFSQTKELLPLIEYALESL